MKKSLFTIFTILAFLIKIHAQLPSWNTNGGCTGADPSLQSIMINPCGVEVYTEFFIFNTGTSSFDPSAITVQGSNGVPGNPPIITGYTGSHPDMATMLAKLNSWTGCGGVFVAAPALIPPNSQVMAFNAGFNGNIGLNSISPAPNLSSYCGKTIYVVAASYPGAADVFKMHKVLAMR